MPDGSQSWKMIKPPGTQAGRIAQACDRCRSKKIRCDGKQPSCTQCTNVGFECRTSDKLSRRAFPRGYTESLEDHIRQLETENRNLKQMMDNWDDRMELVSRVESLSPSAKQERKKTETISSFSEPDADELLESFCMHEPQSLTMDGTYQGSSSGFAFADILRKRLKDLDSSTCLGHMSSLFKTIDLSSTLPRYVSDSTSSVVPSLPPRVLADQLVDSFFRDWHSLFPILHIPTFRSDFQRLYSSSTLLGKEEFLVQLYLVFAISARQTSSVVPESVDLYERQWRKLLCTLEHKNSLKTLQTLILAQIYTCLMGQDSDLWQFKMKAIGMALRLGLNRPKEQFSSHRLSPLEVELRLRAFWSAFSLDAFSSAALGMPPILRLDDIACQYPTDIDDEFMSDKTEHCTALPNKETKISAAIELARFSRVLSRILTSLYYSPSNSTRSYNKILELDTELNEWRDRVVPHLKFDIKSPVPSSELRQHARTPCLAIAYHYARILIHRPTVTLPESSDLRKSSILAMTESATAIIGITSHLRLRDLKFTLCVNQAKLLVSCGLIVLYSTIDLHEGRKVVGETRKVMCKCLAGICDNPGVSNLEYRAFESLSDAILGTPAAEINSPLPTFAKSEKLHGLVNSNDDLERIRASDGQIASITISQTPESKSDDGVLFHTSNEVDSTNTLSILQRIDGGRKRLAIPQDGNSKQQFDEYNRSAIRIVAANEDVKDETVNDTEIENLFAMMDGMTRESGCLPSKRVKETASALRCRSSMRSSSRRRSSQSTSTSSSSGTSGSAELSSTSANLTESSMFSTVGTDEINRALSVDGSTRRRSSSSLASSSKVLRRKHKIKTRHNSMSSVGPTPSAVDSTPPLPRLRPDPAAIAAVASAAVDGTEWNMWWDDLFTMSNRSAPFAYGTTATSQKLTESESSFKMDSGGSTAPSSAPPSVDLEKEQAYVCSPSKVLEEGGEPESPKGTHASSRMDIVLNMKDGWGGLGWIGSSPGASMGICTPK